MERKTQFFKRGVEFPHEGFVQAAIERHFASTGHRPAQVKHSDFACHESLQLSRVGNLIPSPSISINTDAMQTGLQSAGYVNR